MAYNGSGTFSRLYNWVVDRDASVPITASRMDAEMDGMATGLTTAITKDGQSTTTARIPLAYGVGMSDGTVAAPAINFTADTDSGLYRVGANNIGVAVSGAKVLDVATTGLAVTGTLSSTGAITGNLTGNVTGNLTGNVTGNASGTSGSTTGNAATATALATTRAIYGNNFDGTAALTQAIGAAYGGTGVANNASSTLTISGSFGTTITVSALTSVTLPTTGTLATLAGSETFTNKTLTAPDVTTMTYAGTTLTNAVAGTGAMVLATSPTLVTPNVGVATGTSFNGLTVTSTTGSLTITSGKTLSVSNTLTLAGTDSTTMTFPSTTGTVAILGLAQTYSVAQRGTVTTDNDLSFDMAVTNNFRSTPTAGGALTFTNITSGQSGNIHLVNGSNYAITAAATTEISSADLATISASGTYWMSYYCYDGTNVIVTTSADVSV